MIFAEVVSDKAKPPVRVGRKATGPMGWVSRVAKERSSEWNRAFGKQTEARFFMAKESETMVKRVNEVLTTKEACQYLRISRPTFLKLIYTNEVKARKVGRGWKVLKAELRTYLEQGSGPAGQGSQDTR